jgi:heptosyltransferase-2
LIRHPAEEVLRYNRNADEIIPYMAEEGTNLFTQEFAPFKIREELQKRHYDLVITSEHALRFIVLSYLTGAPNRIGYDANGRGFLLTRKVKYPNYENRNRLEVEYYLDLVRALDISVKAEKGMMKINLSGMEREFAERFLKTQGIGRKDLMIGIHAGGGIWKKRWPLFKFAKLCDALMQKYGAKVIVFGNKDDVLLYSQMQRMMEGKIIIAAGKCTILETAALVERCDLIVANDSAISHIGAAMGAKVIALFGVDSPKRWAPFGNGYIMRHKRLPACDMLCNYDYLYSVDACFDAKTPYCMNLIEGGDVLRACEKRLKRRSK